MKHPKAEPVITEWKIKLRSRSYGFMTMAELNPESPVEVQFSFRITGDSERKAVREAFKYLRSLGLQGLKAHYGFVKAGDWEYKIERRKIKHA